MTPPVFHFNKRQKKLLTPGPSSTHKATKKKVTSKLWKVCCKDFNKLLPDIEVDCPSLTYVGPALENERYEDAEPFIACYSRASPPTSLEVQSQAIAAVMFGGFDYQRSRIRKGCMISLFELWLAIEGAEFVVQAMAESMRWNRKYNGRVYALTYAIVYDDSMHAHHGEHIPFVPGGWEDLRGWLATLGEEDFIRAKAEAARLRKDGSLLLKSALAYALGDVEWARATCEELLNGTPTDMEMNFCVLSLEAQDTERLLEKRFPANLPVTQVYNLVVAYGEQAPRIIDKLWAGSCFEIPRKRHTVSTPGKVRAEVVAAMGCVESIWSARWLLNHLRIKEGVQDAIDDYAEHSLGLLVLAMLEGAGEGQSAQIIRRIWPRHAQQHEALITQLNPTQQQKLERCLADE